MSRAYKDALVDAITGLPNDTGFTSATVERMSGADLAQSLLALRNGASVTAASVAQNKPGGGTIDVSTKSLGINKDHSRLGTVASDGTNTVTVTEDISNLTVGMVIDITTNNYSTARAVDRTVTAINYATKTITYSGTDASSSIVVGDVVLIGEGAKNNAALSGADLERFIATQ
jgi:hypothetical protein